MAQQQGYFEDAGLKVELVPVCPERGLKSAIRRWTGC